MINVADLLSWVVPDPEQCRAEAARLASEHPGASPEELARHAVANAKNWAAAAGGATGAFANPIIMLPAALADMSAVLRIEGTMAGTIAALLDPISLNDPPAFEADLLSIVFPGAISQALRQIGIRAGQRLTRNLIRKNLTQNLVRSASRFAARRLFLHVSERAIVTKTVPLVGAGIGAGWNWLELHAVGNRAMRYYQHKTITPHSARDRFHRARALVKLLPWPRSQRPKPLPPGQAPPNELPGASADPPHNLPE